MADTTNVDSPLVTWVMAQLAQRRWKPAQLTREADIPSAVLSRFLNGQRAPSVTLVKKLAQVFDEPQVEVMKLAGFVEESDTGETTAAAQARAVIEQMSEEDQERALAMLQALAKLGSQRRKQKK